MPLNLFGRLMPREETFTRLFCDQTQTIARASEELRRLMEGNGDPEKHVAAVRAVEKSADELARKVFLQANRVFNAPIDREDILALAHQLDDVVDLIEDAAKTIFRYRIDYFSPYMKEMVDAVGRCGAALNEVMPLLERITPNYQRISELCQHVGQIEGGADASFDAGLSKLRERLSQGEINTLVYIDRKEVYELLEDVVDACNHVANTIQAIAAKHV